MAGLYLEEFSAGQLFRHAATRTITEADNMFFCMLTMNPQPLHIDFHFAAKTPWGKPTVNSFMTMSLLMGLSVYDTTLGTTLANLGMTDVEFQTPLFHGDTLRAETTVISARVSKTRPDRGPVEFEHRGYNQDDVLVARFRRTAMMLARPA